MFKYCCITVLFFILILHSGCQTTDTRPEELPAWVRYPYAAEEFQRFLTGVGYAHENIEGETALLEAKKNARFMLSDQIAAYVYQSLKDFVESHPEYIEGREIGSKLFSQNLADEVVKNVMRRSFDKDVWRFQDGRIHLMLKIPLTVVNETAKQCARHLNKDYRLWEMENEDVILQEFFDSLDSELKARVVREAAIRQYRKAISMGEITLSELPHWLASGENVQFPPENYLLSTGIGLSAEEAEMNAQTEALNEVLELCFDYTKPDANKIPEKIKSQIEMLEFEKINFDHINLIEPETGEFWYDSAIGVHYALAVTDRRKNAERCKDNALEALEYWKYLLRSGINQRQAANFNRAAEDLGKAMHKAESALMNYLIALAIKPADKKLSQFAEKLSADLLSETYIELDKFLSEMELVPESGPDRWYSLEEDQEKVVSVKLIAGDQKEPIEGIPVKFEFMDTQRESFTDKDSRIGSTSPEGIAEADFTRLSARLQTEAFILRAKIAFEHFLPESSIHQKLSGPYYIFDPKNKESKLDIPLSLFIQERTDGTEQNINEGLTARQLINRLKQADVEIILKSDWEWEPREFVTLELDALEEKMKNNVDGKESSAPTYILTGIVDNNITDTRETDFGTLYFAACKVHIVFIEFSENYVKPLFNTQFDGLGTAIDSKKNALSSSAEDAAMKVEEHIQQHFRVK